MNEYSASRKAQFERISYNDVKRFVEIMQTYKLNQKSLIEAVYLDSAHHFFEMVQFLKTLRVIDYEGEKISTGENYEQLMFHLSIDEENFSTRLINLILDSKSLYAVELKAFISKFWLDSSGKLVLEKMDPEEQKYAIRNFLVEAGAVDINYSTGLCTLCEEMEEVYILTQYCDGCSPGELKAKLQSQTELGLLVEEKVMIYEKIQAGDMFAHLVIHVANYNVEAGFDIYSVRATDGKISQRRHIEVKAVNSSDYRFFWTQNERRVAERYGESYFLYLVPIMKGAVLLEQLYIIKDPVNSIIGDPTKWEISTDLIECRRR